jgi:hypothetical protein
VLGEGDLAFGSIGGRRHPGRRKTRSKRNGHKQNRL